MSGPRAYTGEEVRKQFLDHVRLMVDEWDKADRHSCKEKLSGLAFSILVAIDGYSGGLPAFALVPTPHPDDRQYRIDQGSNYYEPFNSESVQDIAGELHDNFYKE